MESVHLLGEHSQLVGVLSTPDNKTASSGDVVILLNSGLIHRVGPFRLYVQLARSLEKSGFSTLRLDQSGRGDSGRRAGLGVMESVRKDFEDAAEFLGNTIDCRRLVVAGLCSGARDALYLASKYPEIAGAVLLDGYAARTAKYYVRHYTAHSRRLKSWKSLIKRIALANQATTPAHDKVSISNNATSEADLLGLSSEPSAGEVREQFRRAVSRNCKILCIFTAGLSDCYNYEGQLLDFLNLPSTSKHITEWYYPDAQHTFPLSVHRMWLNSKIRDWMSENIVEPLA